MIAPLQLLISTAAFCVRSQVGHASKRECHEMVNIRKGMLHRAFSVFMFNSEGKLLLQKVS